MECLCGKEMKLTDRSGDGLEEPRYNHYICDCGIKGDLRQDGITEWSEDWKDCSDCFKSRATHIFKEKGFDDTLLCKQCLDGLMTYINNSNDIVDYEIEELED